MSGEVICLRHFGLVVRDLPRALEFYEGLMGLKPGPSTLEQGSVLDAILGWEGVAVTTVKMRAESGEALLELLDFKNPPTAGGDSPPIFYRQGPTHLAFTVKNLPVLLEQLAAAGVEIISPARRSSDGKVLVTFCRDYEGNLIELVQPVPQE